MRAYATRIKSNLMNIIRALPALVLYFLATSFSHAALTPIGPPPAQLCSISQPLPTNTEANGLIVDGVLFQATKNGSSTNGVVIVDGGPGTTGNITPPNLVSLSDLNAIALIVSLPNLAIQFGYGYALMLRFLSQSVLPSNFLPARHRSVAFPLRGFPIRSSPGVKGALLVIRHSIVRS